jgi:hypothetical protein
MQLTVTGRQVDVGDALRRPALEAGRGLRRDDPFSRERR